MIGNGNGDGNGHSGEGGDVGAMKKSKAFQWEFPEDLIVDRAMLNALILELVSRGVIDAEKLRTTFERNLQELTRAEETEESKATVS